MIRNTIATESQRNHNSCNQHFSQKNYHQFFRQLYVLGINYYSIPIGNYGKGVFPLRNKLTAQRDNFYSLSFSLTFSFSLSLSRSLSLNKGVEKRTREKVIYFLL